MTTRRGIARITFWLAKVGFVAVFSSIAVAHPSLALKRETPLPPPVAARPAMEVAVGGVSGTAPARPVVTVAGAQRPVPAPVPNPILVTGSELRTALVVGIDHAVGGSPTEGSVHDAMNVRTALTKYGFPERNITTLIEGAASRGAILAGLRALAERTAPGGIAVISISTHSGHNSFRTAEGARVTKQELAQAIGSIRARTWTIMAVCYAGEYAVPGVIGPGRIGTFSSTAAEQSWEVPGKGSYLVYSMVKEGMIDGRAPRSVESAFAYAKSSLEQSHPNRVPNIADGVTNELVLGPVTSLGANGNEPTTDGASGEQSPNPAPTPTPTPTPGPTPTPAPSGDPIGGLLGGGD